MPTLVALPQELLDETGALLPPVSVYSLLLTCRVLRNRFSHSMHLHAISPVNNIPGLHWAIQRNHHHLVSYLLSYFPISLPSPSLLNSPLHSAVQPPTDTAMLTLLLTHGASVNGVNLHGAAPLQLLCDHNCVNIAHVQLLLDHDADVNQADSDSNTALGVSVLHDNDDIAELLLAAGANPDCHVVAGRPPIHLACASNRVGLLRALLAAGADIDYANEEGNTALQIAAQNGAVECVELLMGAGVRIDMVEINGDSAVFVALEYAHYELASIMIRAGVVCNVRSWSGSFPLLWACQRRHKGLVVDLLKRDYSIDGEDVLDQCMCFVKGYWPEIVPLLEAAQKGVMFVDEVSP